MKKSMKKLLALMTAVLLLAGAFTTVAVGATTPTTPTTSTSGTLTVWDTYILTMLNQRELQPDGNYKLPNGQIMTPAEVSALYAKYYAQMGGGAYYPPIGGGTVYPPTMGGGTAIPPTLNNVYRGTLTLAQFQMAYVGYGANFNYTSSNTSVVTVDSNGRAYGVAPGVARITVSTQSYIVALFEVTVTGVTGGTTPTPTPDPIYGVSAGVGSSYITVGETTYLYASITVSGYPTYVPSMELTYAVSDPTVVYFNTATNVITALKAGTVVITVGIKDTDVKTTVTVRVTPNAGTTPDTPSNPGYWGPGYVNPGYYNGITFLADGRIIIDPSQLTVGGGAEFGFTPEMLMYFYGIDVNKYTVEYKLNYAEGSYKRLIVLTPKAVEDSDEDATTPGTPSDPVTPPTTNPPVVTPPSVTTPEELEELKRQEELKANILLTLSGKMSWFDVYNDIYTPNNYSTGITFVLDHQIMVGEMDGSFGAYDHMTYGDVETALKSYLEYLGVDEDVLVISETNKNATITRQELTAVLFNLAKKLNVENGKRENLVKFHDKGDLNAQYADAFSWAVSNNLIITTSTKMTPNHIVTKSVLAQVIYRFNKMVG